MLESSGASLTKWPHLESRTETFEGGRSLLVVPLPVLLTLGRRGALVVGILDVLQSTTSSSSFFCFAGWNAFLFF